ncbi:hypothetical protein PHISP_01328 [Aspergillus sp. HF37]|nr:hypothetical protein PHISP_01328 [Aspergillus sp. HF37]
MSHPYTAKALWNMTQAIEAKLRQERTLLWRARNLHRQFLGDSNWIPCGSVEMPEDRYVFEPKIPDAERHSADRFHRDQHTPVVTPGIQNDGTQELPPAADAEEPQENPEEQAKQNAEEDVAMVDAPNNEIGGKANEHDEQVPKPKHEDADATVNDILPHHEKAPDGQANGDNAENSRIDLYQRSQEAEGTHSGRPEQADGQNADKERTRANPEHGNDTHEEEPEKDAEMQDDESSPEPLRRMTTRAQANAEGGETANRSASPSSDTLSSLPAPHPLFLVPDATRPDPNSGLPPNEADETRRLLWSYVQKQEETVRGFEHMLDSLLRACRMKDDVLEWCKAEGHLDEMSDGEDWYDREKLGLAEGEELKKGADEDDIEPVDDSRATGKRGKGRRA